MAVPCMPSDLMRGDDSARNNLTLELDPKGQAFPDAVDVGNAPSVPVFNPLQQHPARGFCFD